jgi:rhamnogalacturonyl hydrolase YesR
MEIMKRKKFFLVLMLLPCFVNSFAQNAVADSLFRKAFVLNTMRRIANWQINDWTTNGFKKPKYNWTYAAAYTGIFELGKLTKDEKYLGFLKSIGEDLQWNTGSRRFFADDYCVAQTYANLYLLYRDPRMIAAFKKLADSIIARPHTESLSLKNKGIMDREWAWRDALFMGPPSLVYLAMATGEQKYLDIANRLWWKTTDFLYDPTAHLYFRDESYFEKKEKNGAKVFWARGNGWVMAGLVRVLANMPKRYPDKEKYQNLLKEMAAKLASLQQSDGSWHSSLLDPDSYPVKETSSTGFYTYAILWGLNNGILDKKTYWPVVEKAWKALVSSVHPNGMLGYVQPVGAAPDKVDENSTETYGPGSFLLAGSQLYTYLNKNNH